MIECVIFDLGGVIIPLDFARLYERISECSDIPPEAVPQHIGATGLVPLLETGQISGGEFTQRLSASLGLRVRAAEFSELWNALFPGHTLIPESLLASLKGRYRLLLLSNTNPIHFEMILDGYPLLRQFDEYVLSYKVGAMKPSPLIYQAAIARAGCEPRRCFFTDDIPAYAQAARDAGMDAVQFQSYEQIVGELGKRGIHIS